MGLTIDQFTFTQADTERFSTRLHDNLHALESVLKRPGFGEGELSFGAELELYIVDPHGRPLPLNQEIQKQLGDEQLTLELNSYNLEYNFSPVLVKDNCFARTEAEALAAIQKINNCAKAWNGTAVPVGILPTLQQSDTGYHAMTKLPRYEALTRQLAQIRGGPFKIAIEGEETIQLAMDDVTLEGANTSFQIHLRIPPAEFADFYNALQLVTPLVLALGANSPTLFGHRLWHETRIPLFKQSIDCRQQDPLHPIPARVNFGNNWVREGALELFAEAVHLFEPILPISTEEDAISVANAGDTPQLRELRMQQGTIWLWNRPVYDPVAGGHLRIEMRALPAGPSIVDMMANAALLIGLTKLMQPRMKHLLPAIPFAYCSNNFYRAAQLGLNAELIWPSKHQNEPQYHTVYSILGRLLPEVGEQLEGMGFVKNDFSHLLTVIEERLTTRQTGAQWQLDKLTNLRPQMPRQEALIAMFQEYQANSAKNLPVAQWK